jgi:hypothetical protein
MATKPKEDEGKFISDCIEEYRSLPALWNVEEQGLQQRNKKMNNTNICFENIERDFWMLIRVNLFFKNLIFCVLTSENN